MAETGAVLAVTQLLLGCCRTVPESRFPSAADALDRMKATYACANGIQGEARIDHFGEKGRVRGEVTLFAVNPARVRIEVLNPFVGIILTLTSDGDTFRMNDVKARQFLFGPATPCNLARLTQVPMPGHVLVSLMRGEAPLLVHERSPSPRDRTTMTTTGASMAVDCDTYRVEIPSTREARQVVKLQVYDEDYDKPWQSQRVRVTEVTTVQRGAVLYTAELKNHERAKTAPPREDPEGLDETIPPSGGVCDAEIPRSIRMRVPSTGDDVIFQYSKVAFNPPIPAGAFTQPVPPGSKKIRVDCRE